MRLTRCAGADCIDIPISGKGRVFGDERSSLIAHPSSSGSGCGRMGKANQAVAKPGFLHPATGAMLEKQSSAHAPG